MNEIKKNNTISVIGNPNLASYTSSTVLDNEGNPILLPAAFGGIIANIDNPNVFEQGVLGLIDLPTTIERQPSVMGGKAYKMTYYIPTLSAGNNTDISGANQALDRDTVYDNNASGITKKRVAYKQISLEYDPTTYFYATIYPANYNKILWDEVSIQSNALSFDERLYAKKKSYAFMGVFNSIPTPANGVIYDQTIDWDGKSTPAELINNKGVDLYYEIKKAIARYKKLKSTFNIYLGQTPGKVLCFVAEDVMIALTTYLKAFSFIPDRNDFDIRNNNSVIIDGIEVRYYSEFIGETFNLSDGTTINSTTNIRVLFCLSGGLSMVVNRVQMRDVYTSMTPNTRKMQMVDEYTRLKDALVQPDTILVYLQNPNPLLNKKVIKKSN